MAYIRLMAKASTTKSTDSADRAQPRVSRAQKSLEVQGAITASALELLDSDGVDGLALTKVAANAGLSSGPLYGRYDSAEDIALELWQSHLQPQIAKLVHEFDDFLATSATSPPQWFVDELSTPSMLTSAGVEVIAVARRHPLLLDTVRDDIDELFDQVCARNPDQAASLCSLRLSIPIGYVLLSRSTPPTRPPLNTALLQLRDALSEITTAKQISPEIPPTELPFPIPDTGDIGLDEFVSAVMEVVSRVGFEKTTAHRVARAAGHSFSSAYTHVGTKDELMHMAISKMIDQIWATGTASFLSLETDDYKSAVVALHKGLTGNANRGIRQLRTETALAMRHHADLAESGMKRLQTSLARIVDLFPEKAAKQATSAEGYWYISNASGMGVAALSLLTNQFNEMDWRPIGDLAWTLAAKTTIEPLRKLKKLPSA